MFTTILYYVIIIAGSLYIATSIVCLIDKLDHPEAKPVLKSRSLTFKRHPIEKAENRRYVP